MAHGHYLALDCFYFFERAQVLTLAGKAKRLDIDNRLKPLIDAITRLIYIDDCNVWEGSFHKRVTAAKASCSVQIRVVRADIHISETNSMATP